MHKKSSMKKFFFILLGSLSLAVTVKAQPGGGFILRTPEERAAAIHQKLDSAFQLSSNVLANLDTALIALYKTQNAKREELFAGGGMPDRETMQKEMKKFSDAQDKMFKAVLTKDQYDIWKDKIQPGMRPQRPPGPPGGGNQ